MSLNMYHNLRAYFWATLRHRLPLPLSPEQEQEILKSLPLVEIGVS